AGEGRLHAHELVEDVVAVQIVLYHLRDSPDLPLNFPEAREHCFFPCVWMMGLAAARLASHVRTLCQVVHGIPSYPIAVDSNILAHLHQINLCGEPKILCEIWSCRDSCCDLAIIFYATNRYDGGQGPAVTR